MGVAPGRRTRTNIHPTNCAGGWHIHPVSVVAVVRGIVAPLAGALLHNVGAALVLFNSARLLGFTTRPATRTGVAS